MQKLGSGDCPTMPCDVVGCIVLPKGLVRPGSTRNRHQRSDGDCALSLGTHAASKKAAV